jgi:hypothetical protein
VGTIPQQHEAALRRNQFNLHHERSIAKLVGSEFLLDSSKYNGNDMHHQL